MKVAVLQFSGTNCEFDAKYAFTKLGCDVEVIWHKDTKLPENTDLVVVPGNCSTATFIINLLYQYCNLQLQY